MTESKLGIFDEVRQYPDPSAARRFGSLVGLDEAKERLVKEARLLLDPESLAVWCINKHQRKKLKITELFHDRPALFIFSGDVGTGKTVLAETFGDVVAREIGIPIQLFALSLSARGTGTVGEMTQLISVAFSEVKEVAKKAVARGGKNTAGIVFLIDEADALAQSRESGQMHHEDRAGVNALIRGLDSLAAANLPVVVVMCTNRLGALDPAVRRRSAVTLKFNRPDDDQRAAFLRPILEELNFTSQQIRSLVTATGAAPGRSYGYTYSDLAQRLLPGLVLAAYPSNPITFDMAKQVLERHPPTPPFREDPNLLTLS